MGLVRMELTWHYSRPGEEDRERLATLTPPSPLGPHSTSTFFNNRGLDHDVWSRPSTTWRVRRPLPAPRRLLDVRAAGTQELSSPSARARLEVTRPATKSLPLWSMRPC